MIQDAIRVGLLCAQNKSNGRKLCAYMYVLVCACVRAFDKLQGVRTVNIGKHLNQINDKQVWPSNSLASDMTHTHSYIHTYVCMHVVTCLAARIMASKIYFCLLNFFTCDHCYKYLVRFDVQISLRFIALFNVFGIDWYIRTYPHIHMY